MLLDDISRVPVFARPDPVRIAGFLQNRFEPDNPENLDVLDHRTNIRRDFKERRDRLVAPSRVVTRRCLERTVNIDAQQGADLVVDALAACRRSIPLRSEEHTSELQSLMRISYAVFCLKKKKTTTRIKTTPQHKQQ